MPSDHVRADRITGSADRPDRLQRHKAYEAAYETWFATLPEDVQRQMKEQGLDKPATEQFGPVRHHDRHEELLGDDLADESDWQIEASADDRQELERAITKALYWALEGKTIVEVGWRMMMVMRVWQSPLIAGLTLEFDDQQIEECRRKVGDDDDDDSSGRIFEWLRRGGSFSQVGERVMAMAYVISPMAIGSASLQAIGRFNNKTRQAVDKMVQEFRDTFDGVRSRSMRDDDNRMTCRLAQLKRTGREANWLEEAACVIA